MWLSANRAAVPGPVVDATGAEPRAIVVIGNPENRRVQMFCAAASRLDLPAPRVIAYGDLLDNGLDVKRAVMPQSLVRIESPGENEPVERALIALGASETPDAERPRDYTPGQPVEHGRIYCPRLWYRGFCRLLETWQQELDGLPVAWMNHPDDIRLAFDKAACQAFLDRHGIPVPRRLGTVASYDDLRAANAQDEPQPGVFETGPRLLGLRRRRPAGQPRPDLRDHVGGGRPSRGRGAALQLLGLARYESEPEVASLVNSLCVHGLHLEAWMPKASLGGRTFDLRVMVIAGDVCHLVMRTSRGPITNLHLGNQRGDLAELFRKIPADRIQEALDTCRRVAALFPRSLYLGIDLVFTPSFRRHAVLELNAFGDLLPGVLHLGQDTYTAELTAATRRK